MIILFFLTLWRIPPLAYAMDWLACLGTSFAINEHLVNSRDLKKTICDELLGRGKTISAGGGDHLASNLRYGLCRI